MKQYENLLKPFKIGSLEVKNRMSISPMSIYEYGAQGNFSNAAIEYYVERAKGGFGLIYTGSMMSDTEIDPFDTSTRFSPNGVPKNWKSSAASMNGRIHAYGAKSIAQVSMGLGRNLTGNKSPSPNPAWMTGLVAGEYTKDEIKRKIELEVQAAVHAKAAGFDGIDIHALHWGYLLDQFAMSITNRRTDEYGGSLENRLRICKEIVEGIKQVNGSSFPVTIRLGARSFMKGLGYGQGCLPEDREVGRDIDESVEIAKLLESFGYDAIGVDLGTYEAYYYCAAPSYIEKGHVLPYSKRIKEAVSIPVLTAGRMDDADLADRAIAEGLTDAIMLGRASLADPHFAKKVEMGIPEAIRPCIACNEGCIKNLMNYGCILGCAVNPVAQRELPYGIEEAKIKKKVMVVGAGPGGMEAAIVAKERGHDVEVYEQSGMVGGKLLAAGAPDFKSDILRLVDWYRREADKLSIPIHMNTAVDAEMVLREHPDAVILAVGSKEKMPRSIPGIDHPKTISSVDALLGDKPVGNKVVIVGGGLVGCEIALDCVNKGKKVTIVEALPEIMPASGGTPWMNAMYLRMVLERKGAVMITDHSITAITDEGACIASVNDADDKTVIEADTVIMAIGFGSVQSMAKDLYGTGIEVYEIKHANGIGNVNDAVWGAYEIARSL